MAGAAAAAERRAGRHSAGAPAPVARVHRSRPTRGPSTRGLLGELGEAGVTRLSLGVQSFAPALRAALGRRVTQSGDRGRVAGARSRSRSRLAGVEPRSGVRHPRADLGRAAGRHRRRRRGRAHAHLPLRPHLHAAPSPPGWRGRWAPAPAGRPAPSPRSTCRRPPLGSRRPATGATRSPTSRRPGTSAGTTRPTGAARTTWGWGRRRSPRSAASGAPTRARWPTTWPASRREIEVLSPRTRLWEKAMLGLRTAEGVDEEEVLPVLDRGRPRPASGPGTAWQRRCGRLRLNPGFLDVSNSGHLRPFWLHPEES